MKILAIDDNQDNLTALKAVVADQFPKARVLTAGNGPAGLELAQSEAPDVILLDIVMPGMDGYAVCRKLKQDPLLQAIPVLFLTALKTDRNSRVKALEAGAEGFLTKPFDEIELSAQIRAMAKIKAAALMQKDDRERLAEQVEERTQALQLSQTTTLKLLDDLKTENEARKNSEAALRRSEENFRRSLDDSPFGVRIVTEEGETIYANQAILDIYGFSTLAEFSTTPVEKRYTSESYAEFKKRYARRRQDGNLASEYEVDIVRKSGEVRHLLVSRKRLLWNGKWQYQTLCHDITERKRMELALQLSQQRLLLHVEQTPLAVIEFDIEGRVREWNPTAAKMFGYAREEAVGQYWSFIVPAEIHGHLDDVWANIVGQRGGRRSTNDNITRDGRRISCEWFNTPLVAHDGKAIGMASLILDVTERKLAEDARRESEEDLNLALRASHMGAWRLDLGSGMRHFDEQACCLLGLNPATFDGSAAQFFGALHPDDREKISAALTRVITRDVPYESDYRALWPDGSIHYINSRGRLVRDETGRPLKISGIIWDITERRLAEIELQKMRQLQSVGTLAGGIAHDFNNILTGLFGNIYLAKSELAAGHSGYAFLEEAEKSMSRAVRLTNQLLTFAKGGDPIKEDVSLGALVEEVVNFDLSGSKTMPVYRRAENLWMAVADKGQLQQVISNLTINAHQAMPEGGRLYIAMENSEIGEGAVPGLRQGKYVRISVRDEGTGIDPKYLDRIFDPYFTTKQAGNGLGLATVYSIVNKHGGHISVVSEPGKGTTFTLYLPASESTPAQTATPPPAASASAIRPGRILVMDDENAIRVIAGKILTRNGFSVATAVGGHETVELYKQAMAAGAPFDLVIMDLTIPGGIGGKEAIKRLMAIDPQVKAIVSSGYADDPVMANHAEYGFKGIVAKPYTQSELLEAVLKVVGL